MSIMPPDPDSKTKTPEDDTIVVAWRDCNCDWVTKYCDDEHTRYTAVSKAVLRGDAR